MDELNKSITKKERHINNIYLNKYNISLSPIKPKRKKYSNVNYFNNIAKIIDLKNKNFKIRKSFILINHHSIKAKKTNNNKFAPVTEAYISPIKNKLLKKIKSPYIDSSKIYNLMVINNILSKNFSCIKEKYIEILNEIETKDFLKIYTFNVIRCYLKYISVCYDKFHIQFPNYSKDIFVYNKMMSYLVEKQKLIDEIKEDNNKCLLLKNIRKKISRNLDANSIILDSKVIDDINSDDDKYYQKRKGGEINKYLDISKDSDKQLELLVKRINKAENIFNFPKSKSNKAITSLKVLLKKKSTNKNLIQIEEVHNIFENDEIKAKYEIFTKKIRSAKHYNTEIRRNREKLTIEDPLIQSKLKKYNHIENKESETKKTKIKINLKNKNKNKYIQDLKITMKKKLYNNNLLRNTIYIIKNKKNYINTATIQKEKTIATNSSSKNSLNTKNNKFIIDKLKIRAFKTTENYNLYKNRKFLIKNMNDNFNDFRFNTQISLNYPDKINYLTVKKKDDFFSKQISLLNSINKENQFKNNSNQHKKKRYLTEKISNCKKHLSLQNKKQFNNTKKRDYFLEPIFTSPKKYFYDIFNNKYERTETQKDRINSNIITLNKELKKAESLSSRNNRKINLTGNLIFNRNQKNSIENYKELKTFDNFYGGKSNINGYLSKCFNYQNKLKMKNKIKVNHFFGNGIKKRDKKILLIKC